MEALAHGVIQLVKALGEALSEGPELGSKILDSLRNTFLRPATVVPQLITIVGGGSISFEKQGTELLDERINGGPGRKHSESWIFLDDSANVNHKALKIIRDLKLSQ